MSDILHGFIPTAPAPLTDHLRAHLVAQFSADLRRDKAELRALPRQRTQRQQLRFWHLTDRIASLEADLADLRRPARTGSEAL